MATGTTGGRSAACVFVVLALAGACGGRPLGTVADGVGGFSSGDGGATGGLGGNFGGAGGAGLGGAPGTGGRGMGGRGMGGSGMGGRGMGGSIPGVGGAVGPLGGAGGHGGTGGVGLGGTTGAGGAVAVGCDSACYPGEMCVGGVCRGSTSRWPTLGGDVHHSGYNVNETGVPPLTRAWSAALGTAAGLWPAVSDGSTIYVSEKSYFDSATRVWAVAPADGHVLWSYDFGNIFGIGQTTVDHGYVYVAKCNNGGASGMNALVAGTGTLFWSKSIGAQWENYWAPLVTPTGQIYFDGGSYGGLYGLTTADGTQLFFNSMLEQYDEWSPLYLNGRLYSFVAGNLRTHDALTGAIGSVVPVTWNWAGWSMMTAPVSDGDKIYVIAPPSLYALRSSDGKPAWSTAADFSGMPAVANGVVYALSAGQLRAQDSTTGAVLWTYSGGTSMFSYPPVVAGNYVYVASNDIVYAIDIATHGAVWKDAPGGWLSIAAGKVFVAQSTGMLAAYTLTPR